MVKECPECGNNYKKIGRHWHAKPKHKPELGEKLQEIITGLLMGDGCVTKNGENARLEVNMTNKKYLKFLQSKLGVLSSDISLKRSAEDSYLENKNRLPDSNLNKENYSEIYHLRTCTHKGFNKYREWYSSGEKVWPQNINLTPAVLKHWYVTDGHYDTKKSHERIKIAMANEIKNREKVNSYFEEKDLPPPSNYNISERKSGGKSCVAVFSKSASEDLFDYMGSPPQGFKYKWPENY